LAQGPVDSCRSDSSKYVFEQRGDTDGSQERSPEESRRQARRRSQEGGPQEGGPQEEVKSMAAAALAAAALRSPCGRDRNDRSQITTGCSLDAFMESSEVGCKGDAAATRVIFRDSRLDKKPIRVGQLQGSQLPRRHRVRWATHRREPPFWQVMNFRDSLFREGKVSRGLSRLPSVPSDLPLANNPVVAIMPPSKEALARIRARMCLFSEPRRGESGHSARRSGLLLEDQRPDGISRERQGRRSWMTRHSRQRDGAGF
jgi:hypothetical protein